MKIKLLEPLAVNEGIIGKLSLELINQGHEFFYYDTKSLSIDELKERAHDADIVIIANSPFPDEVIEVCSNLKMISVAFTGFDHVGKLAKEKNITVCNAAGYSDQSVAELVLGLTLDLLRNISKGNEVVREGGTISGLIGNELRGKTVGIIGTGRIGVATGKLFKAFGTRVIGCSRSQNPNALEFGLEYVDLDYLLENSDIISLHLPFNQETKNFLSREKLEKIKPHSLLINCARGGVLDNLALAELLNAGKIKGAGVDVFEVEPPLPEETPLLNCKNTVLTPHVAYATEESMYVRAEISFDNVINFIQGEPKNIVNL